MSGVLAIESVATTPYEGQKPGTSGLRKKCKVFMEGNYLHNFVQSIFNALPSDKLSGSTIVVSGDGRFYNRDAIQIIIKMAAANGVGRLCVGLNGLMSTPDVSALIRNRSAYGGIILTASHNPGGPEEDFGIKYNVENGGPAPENVTGLMFEHTKTISSFSICSAMPDIELSVAGTTAFADGERSVEVEVLDTTVLYADMLKTVFDLPAIARLFARTDFSFVYDGMHGVAGAYAQRVLVQELGASEQSLLNCVPSETFNGGHPDPNLTYAHELVEKMGLTSTGVVNPDVSGTVPSFGAAADGDADRNMILGARFFVTPSDSVAVIAANAQACIPFFRNGLRGLARSMPTSGALDLVARKLQVPLFEVPTGWKFFCNLMDSAERFNKEDYTPFICGEESFGTGSNHIREKDGFWAVLCWLQILAARNTDSTAALVSVEDIVREHWAEYGRNYYCRYDYEGVDKDAAEQMMARMAVMADAPPALRLGDVPLQRCDEFEYTDPVDGSVSSHQGMRFVFEDGSRIIFRLSGTGSVGATVRMYLEKFEKDQLNLITAEAMAPLVALALQVSQLAEFTGRSSPTVIT